MDLDDAVVTITVFIALVGALPFVMARLERSLRDPVKARARPRPSRTRRS